MSLYRFGVAALLAFVAAQPAAAQRGRAGEIVGTTTLPGVPSGAAAYRISYRSADARGRPIVVTGAVIVPPGRAPAGGRDVVV